MSAEGKLIDIIAEQLSVDKDKVVGVENQRDISAAG